MKKRKQLFSPLHVLSSILMLALLTWLTVCLPFVNQSQKAAKSQTEQSNKQTDNSNPLSNTNEERSENGTSLLSEYLHETPVMERHFVWLDPAFEKYPSDLYIAYHPDLVIPPPDL